MRAPREGASSGFYTAAVPPDGSVSYTARSRSPFTVDLIGLPYPESGMSSCCLVVSTEAKVDQLVASIHSFNQSSLAVFLECILCYYRAAWPSRGRAHAYMAVAGWVYAYRRRCVLHRRHRTLINPQNEATYR